MSFCNGFFSMFQNKKVIMSQSFAKTLQMMEMKTTNSHWKWTLSLGHRPSCIVERFSEHSMDERFYGQEAKEQTLCC